MTEAKHSEKIADKVLKPSNPKASPSKKKLIIGGIITVLILAIGGGIYYVFFYNKATPTEGIESSQNQGRFQGRNGQRQGGILRVSGTILSISKDSVTVDIDNNGGQKILVTDTNTAITEIVTASKDSILKVGNTVAFETETNGTEIIAKSVRTIERPQNPGGTPQVTRQPRQDGSTPPQGGQFMNRGTVGEVTKISENQVTVKGFNGQESIVTLTTSTVYETTKVITLADLKEGKKVNVSYRGSNIATVISIVPN